MSGSNSSAPTLFTQTPVLTNALTILPSTTCEIIVVGSTSSLRHFSLHATITVSYCAFVSIVNHHAFSKSVIFSKIGLQNDMKLPVEANLFSQNAVSNLCCTASSRLGLKYLRMKDSISLRSALPSESRQDSCIGFLKHGFTIHPWSARRASLR